MRCRRQGLSAADPQQQLALAAALLRMLACGGWGLPFCQVARIPASSERISHMMRQLVQVQQLQAQLEQVGSAAGSAQAEALSRLRVSILLAQASLLAAACSCWRHAHAAPG